MGRGRSKALRSLLRYNRFQVQDFASYRVQSVVPMIGREAHVVEGDNEVVWPVHAHPRLSAACALGTQKPR